MVIFCLHQDLFLKKLIVSNGKETRIFLYYSVPLAPTVNPTPRPTTVLNPGKNIVPTAPHQHSSRYKCCLNKSNTLGRPSTY